MQARDPQRDDGDAEARSSDAAPGSQSTRRRRTMIMLGLLRAGVTSLLLLVLYYVLPLDTDSAASLAFGLVLGLVVLAAATFWEVRAIVRSRYPGIRAIQALATIVPLFVLLFASTYFMLSSQAPTTFSEPLTRSDALYFTVSTFATVGFGDIVPRSEAVRLLVTGQILLDLILLGLGLQVILGAVKKSRGVAGY
ncbi:ion channel [Promicromonospora sp. AC04]|nr:ion channel [Promicromonospora sp. AC04]